MDDVCVALSSVPARLLEAHRKIDLLKSVFEAYKTALIASAKAHINVAATGASAEGDGGGGGGVGGNSPRRRGRAGGARRGQSGGGGGGGHGGHSGGASSGVTARIISPSEALGMIAELGDITWRWTRSVQLICSEQLSSEVGRHCSQTHKLTNSLPYCPATPPPLTPQVVAMAPTLLGLLDRLVDPDRRVLRLATLTTPRPPPSTPAEQRQFLRTAAAEIDMLVALIKHGTWLVRG